MSQSANEKEFDLDWRTKGCFPEEMTLEAGVEWS